MQNTTAAHHTSAEPERLEPGRILGTRYRIISLLGSGGMGVVYRARDLELEIDVALKLLKQDLLNDARAFEKLKSELLIARRVSHPNVARIHDLVAEGAGAGLKYISMAYIDGRTLRDVLNEDGKLPLTRALPILRDLCAGLQAAHDVGVVHRDFKPENIMLDLKDRPYITDFGIARSVDAKTATRTAGVTGTLQYMSPEQARGETVDHRSDIYSFGLVAYEAITGRLPHETETTPDFVARLMGKKAVDPRRYELGIPGYLAGVILRCLDPDPSFRYSSARDVAEAIECRQTHRGAPHIVARIVRPLRTKLVTILMALSVILAGGLLAYRFLPRAETSGLSAAGPAAPAPAPKSSVAVLPLVNRSSDGQLDWLRMALAEILGAGLVQSRDLRIANAGETFQLLRDLKVEAEASQSDAVLRQVSRFLDCDLILAGSFGRVGQDVVFELKLFRSGAGAIVEAASFRRTTEIRNVFAAATELVGAVRGSISPGRSRIPEAPVMTRSVEALREYSEGLGRLRLGEFGQAIDWLSRAVRSDPGFALAHARLSEAHYQWGRIEEAKRAYESALTAIAGSAQSSLLDSLQIRAQYALLHNDVDAAIKLYSEAAEAYPHDVETRLALAECFERKGDLDGAVAGYEAVSRIEPNNFRVSLALGRLFIMADRYDNAIERLSRALTASTQLKHDQGRADVLNALGVVHQRMWRFDEAERSFHESIALKEKIGDKRGIAVSLQNISNLYSLQGKFDTAEARAIEAKAVFEEIQNAAGTADVLFNLGHIYQDTGRFPKALESFRNALTIARDLGNPAFLAQLDERIGQVYYFMGQYADADTYQRQALSERERMDDKAGVIRSLQSLADIDTEQGRYTSALDRYRDALERGRSLGHDEAMAVSLSQMGLVYQLTGRYKAALASYDEAYRAFSHLKIMPRIAELEKRLGSLHIEIGDATRAREHLHKAETAAVEVKDGALSGQVAALRGELALAEGSGAQAAKSFQEAVRSARASGYVKALLAAQAGVAAFECRWGDRRQGVAQAEALLRRAEQMGQADVMGRCYVILMQYSPAAPDPGTTKRRVQKLRDLGLSRHLAELACLAAKRIPAGKPGGIDYASEYSRAYDQMASELSGEQRAGLRRLFISP